MEQEHNQQETRTDFRKTNDANRQMIFRIAAICLILYWLVDIVKAYMQGGADAPSLTLLILALVIMGGGSIVVGFLTWRTWKKSKAEAVMSEEEVAQLEALRADEEQEQ